MVGNYNLEVTALAVGHRLTSPDSTDGAGTTAVTAGLLAGGTLKIELGALTGSSGTYSFTADAAREQMLRSPHAPGAAIDPAQHLGKQGKDIAAHGQILRM